MGVAIGDVAFAACPGDFARMEVEGAIAGDGLDGPVVEALRALNGTGNPALRVTFWQPGPNVNQLTGWYDAPCDDDCAPPAGFDEIDAMLEELQTFVEISQNLRAQSLDTAVSTWYSWVPLLYDPADTRDYFDTLETLVVGDANGVGLLAWKSQLQSRIGLVPACLYDADGKPTNAPCQEQLLKAIEKIDNLVAAIEAFRGTLPGFYEQVLAAFNAMGTPFGGVNPMSYAWKDSRGTHAVQVEVSNFKLPQFKKKTSGSFLKKKICMVLDGARDDGTNTWVAVRRRDPSSNLGLWQWNAWAPGMADWTLNKKACAAYTPTSVNLATCR